MVVENIRSYLKNKKEQLKKKLRCLDKIEFLNTSSDENTIVGSYKIESPSCDHTKQQKEKKSLSSPIYQESENGPERSS